MFKYRQDEIDIRLVDGELAISHDHVVRGDVLLLSDLLFACGQPSVSQSLYLNIVMD